MKLQKTLRSFLFISGSALFLASNVHAETLYWDGGSADILTNGNGASTSAAGTWNNTLLNWDRGAVPHTNWNSSNPDYAVIAVSSPNVITVGSGIVTSGIDFIANGTTLDATSSGLGFSSGSNQLRLAGNNWSATINGAISGTGSMNVQAIHTGTLGFNAPPTINFGGTSTGGWTGATTITRGIAVNLQGDNQALNSTSGITLNGGMIRLTNTDATSITNNRINNSAAITINGGGGIQIANTAGAGRVYSEDIGDVTLNSGYSKIVFTANQNGGSGNAQTLTLNSLTRNGHSVVSLAAATATQAIKVTGATQTAAGEIIGAWAISGNGNTDDDYAVYNASGQIANRAATANNTETSWSTAWSATANQNTTVANISLSADRTFNTFRISTGTSTWSVGEFKLATYGLLSAAGTQTINVGTNGFITIPTDNGSGALYLANGNSALTVNAPIRDNGSAKLTLVLSGGNGSAMTLNGNSDYTGGTVIARSAVRNSATSGIGNLEIGHANAFGASTNYLKFDSGLMDLNAFNVTVGEFSGEASSYITASAGGTLTVGTGTTSASATEFKGLITAGQIVKNGAGSLTLSGINTANATTAQYTVNGGTLQFAKVASFFGTAYNAANTANWTKAKTIVNSGGTLAFNVGGTEEFTAANVTTLLTNLGGSNAANEGLQAGSSIAFDTTNAVGTFAVADNIADSTGAGGGAIGLTKLGTGALALSGTSSYTGATTVSAGTLYVTGALNGSAVTVEANSAIGSNGVAGTLGNGLTIAAGGNLDLTGATLASNSTGILGITGGNLTLGNLTFQDLIGWDWMNAAVGTYELIDGGFTVDFGSTAYLDANSAYIFGNGNMGYFTQGSLNAVIVAIPEPSAVLLGGLGLLALLRRRRA